GSGGAKAGTSSEFPPGRHVHGPETREPPGPVRLRRFRFTSGWAQLDRVADLAEDRADRGAQEEQGDDRNDRDEGEDQRVLRETLAFLVTSKDAEERGNEGHGPCASQALPPCIHMGESGATIAMAPLADT